MVVPASRIAVLVARATPIAFKALDALCDSLVAVGGIDEDTRAGRAIAALKVACDVRKATRRRRKR
ncbi:hypothetical protein LCGC14_3102820 [marine sediment metagenome]|uniref:Uncharacterized protein n=1 Tax=marine sediment metagenome TaxID=412755 RepID=A0A0F8W7M5_9ZZZZ